MFVLFFQEKVNWTQFLYVPLVWKQWLLPSAAMQYARIVGRKNFRE